MILATTRELKKSMKEGKHSFSLLHSGIPHNIKKAKGVLLIKLNKIISSFDTVCLFACL